MIRSLPHMSRHANSFAMWLGSRGSFRALPEVRLAASQFVSCSLLSV
jgi:hypothetical protein